MQRQYTLLDVISLQIPPLVVATRNNRYP